jgi:hypothetical protein
VLYIVLLASTGFLSQETRGTIFLQNIENQFCHCDYWLHWWIGLRLFMGLHRMPPDGFHHFIEWQRIMVFYKMLLASGFHSQEARGSFFLLNIQTQFCHCDYWLHWWVGLRLFMEFARDATWWFSPLHRLTTNKMCYILLVLLARTGFVSQETRGTCFSAKYWKSMLSLWLLIALMDRVKVIQGVCTGCHLMVFTTS